MSDIISFSMLKLHFSVPSMPPRNQLAKLATIPAYKTPFFVPGNAPIERQLSAYLQNQRASTSHMSFLPPGLRRGALLATPLILSTPLLVHNFRHAQAIRCDSVDPLAKLGDVRNTYARDAQTPVITQSGAPNPKAVRQVSMGSILGVIGGLGISVFSKPLAILLGLGIVVLQVSYTVGRNGLSKENGVLSAKSRRLLGLLKSTIRFLVVSRFFGPWT